MPLTQKPADLSVPKLVLFNKPFGVLSQFRADGNNNFATLAEYIHDKSLRVAGRLDATSEGLLLLTNDGQLNELLTAPPAVLQAKGKVKQHGKTYWVQLDGIATDEQIAALRAGVLLKDGMTLPAQVERLDAADVATQLWQAPPQIAYRRVTSWLAITIFEGKNRQVRRMTAHVGLPCLRLVRVTSSGFSVEGLAVGAQRDVKPSDDILQRLGWQASLAPPQLYKQPSDARKPNTRKPSHKPSHQRSNKNKSYQTYHNKKPQR